MYDLETKTYHQIERDITTSTNNKQLVDIENALRSVIDGDGVEEARSSASDLLKELQLQKKRNDKRNRKFFSKTKYLVFAVASLILIIALFGALDEAGYDVVSWIMNGQE